jgi:uncharacterized protein with von Willebrand factor type A (vWA) domain
MGEEGSHLSLFCCARGFFIKIARSSWGTCHSRAKGVASYGALRSVQRTIENFEYRESMEVETDKVTSKVARDNCEYWKQQKAYDATN